MYLMKEGVNCAGGTPESQFAEDNLTCNHLLLHPHPTSHKHIPYQDPYTNSCDMYTHTTSIIHTPHNMLCGDNYRSYHSVPAAAFFLLFDSSWTENVPLCDKHVILESHTCDHYTPLSTQCGCTKHHGATQLHREYRKCL